VSCASAGNCAAGGDYTDRRGNLRGFVVSERNGVWGTAIEVPGLAALNAGGGAGVTSVSCASAGNCAAGGDYDDRHGIGQGFVVSERHGRWGTAIEVPGLGALSKFFAEVLSVSCGSAGNCAVGGDYAESFSAGGIVHLQGFRREPDRIRRALAPAGLVPMSRHQPRVVDDVAERDAVRGNAEQDRDEGAGRVQLAAGEGYQP